MTEPDDAPLNRTDERVTKADLFDAAQWLDRRIAAVRDDFAGLQAGSGDITDRIMGDLAGIRAEQMHLSRQLEMLASELKLDIRKELRTAGEADRTAERASGAGRWAGALMGLLTVIFLAGVLALVTFVLPPGLGLENVLPQGWTPWRERPGP